MFYIIAVVVLRHCVVKVLNPNGVLGLCRLGFTMALHWFNHLDWCICAAAYERKKGSPHCGASLLIM